MVFWSSKVVKNGHFLILASFNTCWRFLLCKVKKVVIFCLFLRNFTFIYFCPSFSITIFGTFWVWKKSSKKWSKMVKKLTFEGIYLSCSFWVFLGPFFQLCVFGFFLIEIYPYFFKIAQELKKRSKKLLHFFWNFLKKVIFYDIFWKFLSTC